MPILSADLMSAMWLDLEACSLEVQVNSLRPRWNEQHFADDIFKRIFFNENVWISIKISLKFVPKGPINNMPALVQIMAWRRSGDKPLSEPMMVRLPMHICVTRPQWVNDVFKCQSWDYVNWKIAVWEVFSDPQHLSAMTAYNLSLIYDTNALTIII